MKTEEGEGGQCITSGNDLEIRRVPRLAINLYEARSTFLFFFKKNVANKIIIVLHTFIMHMYVVCILYTP